MIYTKAIKLDQASNRGRRQAAASISARTLQGLDLPPRYLGPQPFCPSPGAQSQQQMNYNRCQSQDTRPTNSTYAFAAGASTGTVEVHPSACLTLGKRRWLVVRHCKGDRDHSGPENVLEQHGRRSGEVWVEVGWTLLPMVEWSDVSIPLSFIWCGGENNCSVRCGRREER